MKPLFIEKFLPQQVLDIAHSYMVTKHTHNTKSQLDTQTGSIITDYGDTLMETMLDFSTSVVEQNVGKKLWPTYSYFRIYDKGSTLPIHKDRPSCEYTVALCLGCDPVDVPYDIFVGEVDEKSDYKFYDDDENWNRYRIDYKFPMLPNNALLFKGMEKIHWREYCTHDYFMTVFLHYVDQEGEYKEYKFDKRSDIGAMGSGKDPYA